MPISTREFRTEADWRMLHSSTLPEPQKSINSLARKGLTNSTAPLFMHGTPKLCLAALLLLHAGAAHGERAQRSLTLRPSPVQALLGMVVWRRRAVVWRRCHRQGQALAVAASTHNATHTRAVHVHVCRIHAGEQQVADSLA